MYAKGPNIQYNIIDNKPDIGIILNYGKNKNKNQHSTRYSEISMKKKSGHVYN